jgi:hypothetical protein
MVFQVKFLGCVIPLYFKNKDTTSYDVIIVVVLVLDSFFPMLDKRHFSITRTRPRRRAQNNLQLSALIDGQLPPCENELMQY